MRRAAWCRAATTVLFLLVPIWAIGAELQPETEPPLESLLDQLRAESNPEQRRAAAYALGQRGPQAVVAVSDLAACLASQDLQLCWYAADALGRIGPGAASAVPTLVEEIDKPQNLEIFPVVALRALGQIGEADIAKPLLLARLGHEDLLQRVAAGLSLWQIDRDRRGVATLFLVANAEPSEAALLANVALLQVDGLTDEDFRALLPVLRHGDNDVRLAAAKVVGNSRLRIIGDLAPLLDSRDLGEHFAATTALHDIIDDVRENVLYSTATSEQAFLEAARPLVVLAAPALLKQLAEADVKRRNAAERALAKLGPLVLAKLLPLLASDDLQLRASAVAVLDRMQHYLPNASAQLAGMALVKRGAAKPMLEALRNEDVQVRISALRILSLFPLPEQRGELTPLLRSALRDENIQVRRFAASVLEQMQVSASN